VSPDDFDELIGSEPAGPERERLRRTHELLLAAGPPPELSPELEAGPTLAMTLGRPPRRRRRRAALLLAATIAVAAVFLGGYVVGNRGGSSAPVVVHTIELTGTSLAPNALASLSVQRADLAGNWPMTLDATGLPALPGDGYYAVYVVRNGKPWKPCGWFTVDTPRASVSVTMTSPYQLEQGDSWIVTKQAAGSTGAGQPVLEPTSA
jgi:hypothetical protein